MIGLENLGMESLRLLLGLTISGMGILAAMVGYFWKKQDSSVTQATKNLTKTTESLAATVQQLENIVNGLGIKYELEYAVVKEQLKMHRKDIDSNSEKILEVKEKLDNLITKHEMIHDKKNGK